MRSHLAFISILAFVFVCASCGGGGGGGDKTGGTVDTNQALALTSIGFFSPEQRMPGMEYALVNFRNPTYFFYSTLFGLLLTAVIFCRTIPGKDGQSRMPFTDSLALASFYQAIEEDPDLMGEWP